MKIRGTYRRTVALWIAIVCLAVAIPGTADAGWLSAPSVRDQAEASPEQGEAREASLWSSLWDRLEHLWGKSVFINPEGGEGDDTSSEGGGDDDADGSQGNQGGGS